LAGALASLAIPLLFNQGKKPYDVVQFLPYFLLVMGIMTTVTFCKLARGRGIHVQILGLLVTITVFLFLVRGELTARLLMTDYESSPIRFESDFGFYKQGAKVVVPKDILLAAEYIRAQTPREAIFLLPPSRTNVSFLWFPALTGRRTVFSGEFFAYQVGLDTARRRQEVEDIFAGKKEGDFAYVYLDRHDLPRYGNIEQRADWRRIWGNEAAIILERVK
jgi:hypothetical protein